MQTFLPYADYEETARCLDDKRLGKQRVEGLQILKCLLQPEGNKTGWRSHPAVLQWRSYEAALAAYVITICREWKRRGHRDTVEDKVRSIQEPDSSMAPHWLGREDYHASHRSNLLRKNPEWYQVFGWSESDSIEYVWPVRKAGGE